MRKHLIKRSMKNKELRKRAIVWLILITMILTTILPLFPALKADAANFDEVSCSDEYDKDTRDDRWDIIAGNLVKDSNFASANDWVDTLYSTEIRNISDAKSHMIDLNLLSEDDVIIGGTGIYGSGQVDDEGYLGNNSTVAAGYAIYYINPNNAKIHSLFFLELLGQPSFQSDYGFKISVKRDTFIDDISSNIRLLINTVTSKDNGALTYFPSTPDLSNLRIVSDREYPVILNDMLQPGTKLYDNIKKEYEGLVSGTNTSSTILENMSTWALLAEANITSSGQTISGSITSKIPGNSSGDSNLSITLGGDSSDSYPIGDNGKLSSNSDTFITSNYISFLQTMWNDILKSGSIDANVIYNDETNQINNPIPDNCYVNTVMHELLNLTINMAKGQVLNTTPSMDEKNPDIVQPWDNYHIAQYAASASIWALANGKSTDTKFFISDKKGGIPHTVSITPQNSTLSSYYNGLTTYQKASLSAVYSNRIAFAMDDGGLEGSVFSYGLNELLAYDTNGKVKDLTDHIDHGDGGDAAESLYDLGNILKQGLQNFRKSSYTNSGTTVDVARYASLVGIYAYYHAMLHRSGESQYTSTILDGTDIYDATIEAMGNNVWNNDSADLNLQFQNTVQTVAMPEKVMKLDTPDYMFVAKEEGAPGDRYFQMLQRALFAISYAFEINATSEFGAESGYTPETLLKYFTGGGDDIPKMTRDRYDALFGFIMGTSGKTQMQVEQAATTTDFGSEGTASVWILKCIIELYDLCTYLEIDPVSWSPTINAYYQIYEANEELFGALRKNPVIMGSGYDGKVNVENPLGRFFGQSGTNAIETSIAWNKGFALSATYVPFSTNIYDSALYNSALESDQEWLIDFYYRYGFHRKALYISTDPNIVVNNAIGRTSSSGTKVATLKDLLNCERDIILYVDENFYNADVIKESLSRTDYTTIRSNIEATERARAEAASTKNNSSTANQSESNSAIDDSVNQVYSYENNYIDEILNLNVDNILKTNGVNLYSTELASNVTQLGSEEHVEETIYDAYILSSESIIGKNNVIDLYEYSPITAYGIVSAIYRDVDMYNLIQSTSQNRSVVFESSKNIINTPNTSSSQWYPFYNYIMTSGIEDMMNVNTDSKLDLDSPIFIDIFGNIITESGYVIIPAAANATLCGKSWSPYTMAFAYYTKDSIMDRNLDSYSDQVIMWLTGDTEASNISYEDLLDEGEEYLTTTDLTNIYDVREASIFVANKNDGKLHLKNCLVTSHNVTGLVQWNTINANSTIVQELFYSDAYYNKARDLCIHNSSKILNLILEVLRGAPLENIDYAKEGLSRSGVSQTDIVGAYALDFVVDALSRNDKNAVNSVLAMPNLFFMEYLDYIAYFSIKIVIVIMVFVALLKIYQAGVRNHFGIKHVLAAAINTVIFLTAIYIIPTSVTWTYDDANARILKEEAADILLYTAIREGNGQEISVTDVQPIDTNTELLVEVGAPTLSWSTLLGKAFLSNDYKSFNDLFDDATMNSPIAAYEQVQRKGSKLYMSATDILDSSVITYSRNVNMLSNYLVTGSSGSDVNKTYSASIYSFVSPYYTFLEQLIASINEFNTEHDVQSFTYSVDKSGVVQTYDLAGAYFTSGEFMLEGYDILGLYETLDCTTKLPIYASIWANPENNTPDLDKLSNKDKVRLSEWWAGDLDEETKVEKINNVYEFTRKWVAEHESVIKRIPDEQFIKVVAFVAAIKYNEEFNCAHADAIRLMSVDNRDLIRFMVSDFSGVYFDYPYSIGRFVLNQTNIVGIILTVVLFVIMWLSNMLKPILLAVFFTMAIVNLLLRKYIREKENEGIEGFLISIGFFMGLNYLYALAMKLTFTIAQSTAAPITAICVALLVQVGYLLLLGMLSIAIFKDPTNMGMNSYRNVGGMASSVVGKFDDFIHRRKLGGSNGGHHGVLHYIADEVLHNPDIEDNGPMTHNDMRRNDDRRLDSAFKNNR